MQGSRPRGCSGAKGSSLERAAGVKGSMAGIGCAAEQMFRARAPIDSECGGTGTIA